MKTTTVSRCLMLILCAGQLMLSAQSRFDSEAFCIEFMKDSRNMRDLKNLQMGFTEADQRAFNDTWAKHVARPVNESLVEYVSRLDKYKGKRVIVHEFRTPGSSPYAINTDSDKRILVEAEPNRWVEVPAKEWEHRFYEEFAGRTGFQETSETRNNPELRNQALKQHSGDFRQLCTDKSHIEASLDYSDQGFRKGRSFLDAGQIKLVGFNPDGSAIVESEPNILKVKKGSTSLMDAEGLGKMCQEKALEQYRRTEDLKKLLEDPSVNPARKAEIRDRIEMYETEGTVQSKKGVQSLMALRNGYITMGYEVGQLPDHFRQACQLIESVEGGRATDMQMVKLQLMNLGFRDLESFSRALSSQIESFKLMKPPDPPARTPTVISPKLAKIGKVAGIAGDLLGIKQELENAEQGSHLFLNIEDTDSEGMKDLKRAVVAGIELIPIPIISALERGWQVEDEEKARIEALIRSGESPSALISASRAVGKTFFYTVKSMTVDPIISGGVALKEGSLVASDLWDLKARAEWDQESVNLIDEKLRKSVELAEKVQVGIVSLRLDDANGPLIVGPLKHMDVIAASVDRDPSWKSGHYQAVWQILDSKGSELIRHEIDLADSNSHKFRIQLTNLNNGSYRMVFRIFDVESGHQACFEEKTFEYRDRIVFEKLEAFVGDFGMAPMEESVALGEILAFQIPRVGNWGSDWQVEWMIDGQSIKSEEASDPKINRLRFKSDFLDTGYHELAVRAIETDSGKIVAHLSKRFRVKDPTKADLKEFQVRGFVEMADGSLSPIVDRVRPESSLKFDAEIEYLESEKIVPTQLYWQLYDSTGFPLEGMAQVMKRYETGGSERVEFKVAATALPTGFYTLGLTHFLSEEPAISVQGVFPFQVYQDVKIESVQLYKDLSFSEKTDSVSAVTDTFLLLRFQVAEDIGQTDVSHRIYNKTQSTELLNQTIQLTKSGDSRTQMSAVKLPVHSVKEGDELEYTTTVSSGKLPPVKYTETYQVTGFQMQVQMASTIQNGKSVPFTIVPPAEFIEPLRLDVETETGLIIHHEPQLLNGTVSAAIEGQNNVKTSVMFKLSDQENRMVKSIYAVTIIPSPIPPVNPVPVVVQEEQVIQLEWKQGRMKDLTHISEIGMVLYMVALPRPSYAARISSYDDYANSLVRYQVIKGTDIPHGQMIISTPDWERTSWYVNGERINNE